MPDYKKILLVVDLSDDSQLVGERAKAIAACYRSEIMLLHVVEYVPVEPMGEALLPTVQIESELVERARKRSPSSRASWG
jgi:universal stress protein A